MFFTLKCGSLQLLLRFRFGSIFDELLKRPNVIQMAGNKELSVHFRPVTRGANPSLRIFSPLLEICVGQSFELLDIV